MEQVISLEWGRFLRETETAPAENRKKNGRAELGTAQDFDETNRQAFLQGLENALALPPDPGMELYEEEATRPAATAFHPAAHESSNSESSFLEQITQDLVRAQSSAPLETAPDAGNPAPAPQSDAIQVGTYQPRLVWMGTGFEERQVLIMPSEAAIAAPEPQPVPVLETMSDETVLESPAVEEPPSPALDEAPAITPEPQSLAMLEDISIQAAPTSMPYNNLLSDNRAPAPYVDAAVSTPAPPSDTKTNPDNQGSDSARWFVLNGVLGGAPTPEQSPVVAPSGNVPVLEVFSLAGGVGKTSLAATLGRALSARGERVLMVEATPFGSLPYYFGACDCRPGVLRTFRPPASSSDAPIRLATLDSESLQNLSAEQGSLAAEIQSWAQGASRVIVDVATGSTAAARALSPLSPMILVPLVPDVNSVVAANSIDSFFHHQANVQGVETEVYYVLNQVDPTLPLHVEVSKVLRAGLGERLLPFALERTPAVSEALADGMTIIDYAPESPIAEDYSSLAKWLEHAMTPAQASSRGGRWSER